MHPEMKKIRPIPERAEEILVALQYELNHLYVRWKIYQQLYDTNQLRYDLMRETAEIFFAHLDRILVDDTLLAICRVTDPAQTFGSENLTLALLLEQLEDANCEELLSQLKEDAKVIVDRRAAFKDHRDKRLAHTDSQHHLGKLKDALPGVDRGTIEEMLEQIANLLNKIQVHFYNSQTVYEGVVTEKDGQSLIEALAQASEYRSLIQEDQVKWWTRFQKNKYKDA